MKIIILFITLLSLTSCLKTAEEIDRERKMNQQLEDSQNLVADITSAINDLRNKVNNLNGKIEEIEYRQKNIDKKMTEEQTLMKAQQETLLTEQAQMRAEIAQNKDYLSKVTKALEKMNQSAPSTQKKSAKSELALGLKAIKDDKYQSARNYLSALIDHPQLSKGEHNQVLHGLGKVSYYQKKYDESLAYFSKIITEYPKSALAPNCYLFVGRALKKLNKKAEAKQAFEQIMVDYKNSIEAKLAKKELDNF